MTSRASHKYSRQFGVIGEGIASLHVLILGMDGCGGEIAKNLVLMGVKKLTVWDPNGATLPVASDADYNFLLAKYLANNAASPSTNGRVTQGSLEVQAEALQELNPDVVVEGSTDTEPPIHRIDDDDVSDNNNPPVSVCVVASAKFTAGQLDKWNAQCRALSIPIVLGIQVGTYGVVATDFGEHFTVADVSTESPGTFLVNHVTVLRTAGGELKGICSFSEIEGIDREVIRSDVDSLRFQGIDDDDEAVEGKEDERQEKVERKAFCRALCSEPHWHKVKYVNSGKGLVQFDIPSASAAGTLLHNLVDTKHYVLSSVLLKEVYLPQTFEQQPLLTQLASSRVVNAAARSTIFSALYRQHISPSILQDPNHAPFVEGTAKDRVWDVRFQPLCAAVGGIAAQEAIKSTGKHIPLQTPLDLSAEGFVINANSSGDIRLEKRYDHMVAVIGQDNVNLLRHAKAFVVGCGAVGCEHLKNLVLMGVGSIAATDADSIDLSNVTRQFLFRETTDIGKPKSEVACRRVQEFDPAVNIMTFGEFVKETDDNEAPFHDEFWKWITVVMGAVDNDKARFVIDTMSFEHGKPFIECGTSGLSCAYYPALPHVTSCHRGMKVGGNEHLITRSALKLLIAQQATHSAIPICTNKLFPHAPEHCVSWALEHFKGCFACQHPGDEQQRIMAISTAPNAPQEAQHYAQELLTKWFDTDIVALLQKYPREHRTESGAPFWQGSKRFPRSIGALDVLAAIDNSSSSSPSSLMDLVKSFLSSFIHVALAAAGRSSSSSLVHHQTVNGSGEQQPSPAAPAATFVPQEFEKDDDANCHVAFVTACANLRAWNYQLDLSTFHSVKALAGRITPALATTTSVVCGMACIEALKVLIGIGSPLRGSMAVGGRDPAQYATMKPQGPWRMSPKLIDSGNRVAVAWADYEPLPRIRISSSATMNELVGRIQALSLNLPCFRSQHGEECQCFNDPYQQRVISFLPSHAASVVLKRFPRSDDVLESFYMNICDGLEIVHDELDERLEDLWDVQLLCVIAFTCTATPASMLIQRIARHCPSLLVPALLRWVNADDDSRPATFLDELNNVSFDVDINEVPPGDRRVAAETAYAQISSTNPLLLAADDTNGSVWQQLDAHVGSIAVVAQRMASELDLDEPMSLPELDMLHALRTDTQIWGCTDSNHDDTVESCCRKHMGEHSSSLKVFCSMTEETRRVDRHNDNVSRNVHIPQIRLEIVKFG